MAVRGLFVCIGTPGQLFPQEPAAPLPSGAGSAVGGAPLPLACAPLRQPPLREGEESEGRGGGWGLPEAYQAGGPGAAPCPPAQPCQVRPPRPPPWSLAARGAPKMAARPVPVPLPPVRHVASLPPTASLVVLPSHPAGQTSAGQDPPWVHRPGRGGPPPAPFAGQPICRPPRPQLISRAHSVAARHPLFSPVGISPPSLSPPQVWSLSSVARRRQTHLDSPRARAVPMPDSGRQMWALQLPVCPEWTASASPWSIRAGGDGCGYMDREGALL